MNRGAQLTIIKLDISNAYDSLLWEAIGDMFRELRHASIPTRSDCASGRVIHLWTSRWSLTMGSLKDPLKVLKYKRQLLKICSPGLKIGC